jgi:hypothetical protein
VRTKKRISTLLSASFFWISLFLPFCGLANANICNRRVLAEYAYVEDSKRSAEATEVWIAYKNGPNPNPKTVDLSAACLQGVCTDLKNELKGSIDTISSPTVYEDLVLQLRKGDTVIVDGDNHKLGEFLGAGNATHTYKLDGEPGIIRIPFLSNLVLERLRNRPNKSSLARLRFVRKYARQFKKWIKTKVGGVKVTKAYRKTAITIVEEVPGKLSGYSFFQQMAKADADRLEWVHYFPDSPVFKPMTELPERDRTLFKKLLDLMLKNGDAQEGEGGRVFFDVEEARQYLLDEKNAEWRVIDADAPDDGGMNLNRIMQYGR